MITQNDLATITWNYQSTQEWPKQWTKYAVMGNPISHSLSPVIHNTSFRSLQGKYSALANCHYGKIEVKLNELKKALHFLHAQGFKGINVTVPYKTEVIKYISSIDAIAEQVGAVNTLIWEKEGYKGYNTDGYGILETLCKDLEINLAATAVLIIGAGGAAQIAASVCLMAGCSELWMTNRSQDRLDVVIGFLKKRYSYDKEVIHTFLLKDNLPTALPKHSLLIIQSTPLGLSPQDESPIQLRAFDASCKVFDMIYNPWETPLIIQANQLGIQAVNGLSMLLYQASAAFKLWTGIEPDLNLMRSAALSHMRIEVS